MWLSVDTNSDRATTAQTVAYYQIALDKSPKLTGGMQWLRTNTKKQLNIMKTLPGPTAPPRNITARGTMRRRKSIQVALSNIPKTLASKASKLIPRASSRNKDKRARRKSGPFSVQTHYAADVTMHRSRRSLFDHATRRQNINYRRPAFFILVFIFLEGSVISTIGLRACPDGFSVESS
jgi:hypothetical protein